MLHFRALASWITFQLGVLRTDSCLDPLRVLGIAEEVQNGGLQGCTCIHVSPSSVSAPLPPGSRPNCEQFVISLCVQKRQL